MAHGLWVCESPRREEGWTVALEVYLLVLS